MEALFYFSKHCAAACETEPPEEVQEQADEGQVSPDTWSPPKRVLPRVMWCQSMAHEECYLFQDPNGHFGAA